MKRAAIFDLDGTLVHSAPAILLAANAMRDEFEMPPLSLQVLTTYIGGGIPLLVQRCLGGQHQDEDRAEKALQIFIRHYEREPTKDCRLYDGVFDLLSELSRRGWLMGVCTNKSEGFARRIIADMGIDSFFTEIVGGDTLLVKKPDPEPLLHVISNLGSSVAETIFIGDSEVDADTALNAACNFFFFEGGYQVNQSTLKFSGTRFKDYRNLAALLQSI